MSVQRALPPHAQPTHTPSTHHIQVGFPEWACVAAVSRHGGDVEASLEYLMGLTCVDASGLEAAAAGVLVYCIVCVSYCVYCVGIVCTHGFAGVAYVHYSHQYAL